MALCATVRRMFSPPVLRPFRASIASTALLLTALTATACHSTAGDGDHPGTPGSDAAAEAGAGPDGAILDDGGIGPDVPLGAETGPLLRRDAGVDRRVGGTPEERYADFRTVRDGLLIERLVECFNGDPGAQDPVVAGESEVDLSLRFALATFDDKAADACLDAISGEPCQALAAGAHGSACDKVLQGQLATGAFCRVDEDCRDPDKTFCRVGPASICNTRCLPRTADGDRCASGSECLPGSICRPGPDGIITICAARIAEGEACDSDACQPGLYCRASSPDGPDGTCSPIKASGECAGSWQCPTFYSCLIPGMAATGVCGTGLKTGEPCQVQVPDEPSISDCGFGLGCYPDPTSGQLRCSAGRRLDEPCTDRIPCRAGQCVAGKCAALRTQGETCTEALACEEGQVCVEGKCASETLPSGSACGGTEQRSCPAGTFCKSEGDAGVGSSGTCVPSRKLNETCEPGQCEPTLDCVGAICRRCS
jgi:hypothetical protein